MLLDGSLPLYQRNSAFTSETSKHQPTAEVLAEEIQNPATARGHVSLRPLVKQPKRHRQPAYHPDSEVRFYCAHALALLEIVGKISILTELAATEAIFRAQCLFAMASMESFQVKRVEVAAQPGEPETRYGAVQLRPQST